MKKIIKAWLGIFDKVSNRESSSVISVSNIYDYYSLGNKVFSLRCSEIFEATAKDTQNNVLFCSLNSALKPLSKESIKFVQRLSVLSSIKLGKTHVCYYGIDMNGTAFVIYDYLEGKLLSHYCRDVEKVETCFSEVVRQVSEIHSKALSVGDICGHSFLIDKDETISFVGMIGESDSLSLDRGKNLSSDVLSFLSPEHLVRGHGDLTSDVYSLGALLYLLITGRHFIRASDSESQSEYLNSYLPNLLVSNDSAPKWSCYVLQKCLAWSASDRFHDAVELNKFLLDNETILSSQEESIETNFLTRLAYTDWNDFDWWGLGKLLAILVIPILLILSINSFVLYQEAPEQKQSVDKETVASMSKFFSEARNLQTQDAFKDYKKTEYKEGDWKKFFYFRKMGEDAGALGYQKISSSSSQIQEESSSQTSINHEKEVVKSSSSSSAESDDLSLKKAESEQSKKILSSQALKNILASGLPPRNWSEISNRHLIWLFEKTDEKKPFLLSSIANEVKQRRLIDYSQNIFLEAIGNKHFLTLAEQQRKALRNAVIGKFDVSIISSLAEFSKSTSPDFLFAASIELTEESLLRLLFLHISSNTLNYHPFRWLTDYLKFNFSKGSFDPSLVNYQGYLFSLYKENDFFDLNYLPMIMSGDELVGLLTLNKTVKAPLICTAELEQSVSDTSNIFAAWCPVSF